jgi:aubergine-like protein
MISDQSQETSEISQTTIPLKQDKIRISYPSRPKYDNSFRCKDPIVELTTNLINLKISHEENKLCLYSVSIKPELDRNNYSLYIIIQKQIDVDLSNHFTRRCFSGYNLFASSPNPPKVLSIQATVKDVEYTVEFNKVGELDISTITDFEGENQRKKSFLEKVIKDILLKNTNTIKFGDDRTIVQMGDKNLITAAPSDRGQEIIYKGFYTSAQITESGLFLLVSNINKHIMGKTVYEIMERIKRENYSLSEPEKRRLIQEYFDQHKTVLTSYGSFRAYRIKQIDFDASPIKTTFNIKEKNNMIRTVTIFDYYKAQYSKTIHDPDQPLLLVERKAKQRKNNKANAKDKDNNKDTETKDECAIYLVPEFVFATGIDLSDKNNTNTRRSVIAKTKMDPNKKIEEIGKIRELMTNTEGKSYKGRDGNMYKSKSANEISKEWAISLGDNLTVKGRILPAPKLKFGKNGIVSPNNGTFRSGNIYNGANISINNFAYIYDQRDTLNVRNSLNSLFDKGRMKGMNIQFNRNLDGIHNICLKNFTNWESIKSQLKNIFNNKNQLHMVIVFLSPALEKYYSQLKDFFINSCQIATQFIVSKNLQNPKRAGSIMFNLVEQINIKMGGTNFFIDFRGENILKKNKIYLILGLELKQAKGELTYTMTSTTNPNLNKTITAFKKSKNTKEEKEKVITELFENALNGMKLTGVPHPPDYIILYRQGGNYVQNKKMADNEVPIFLSYLDQKKAEDENYVKYNPRFIYVCCNLKAELKFFQNKDNTNISLSNPKSGLCVDSDITQKDKYEFYIQPQFVNQGTATPCHYQVLYDKRDMENEENNLKLEELQLISYYLSFYYWTWAGAVRVPGALKLSTTALDFCSRHLGAKLCLPGETFRNPTFI